MPPHESVGRFDWIVDGEVRSNLALVETRLVATAIADERPDIHAQLVSTESKRLRPAFLLLAARYGATTLGSTLIDAAAALEQVHEATLYHDDIVDRTRVRRRAASLYSLVGAEQTCLVGSELLYRSAFSCSALPDAVRTAIGRAGLELCRGQLRELGYVRSSDVGVLRRLLVTAEKTSSLIRLAMTMGCLSANAPRATRFRLERFALRFGVCFQVVNDLFDLRDCTTTADRSHSCDLALGTYSLPIVLALRSRSTAASRLRRALAQTKHGVCPNVDRYVTRLVTDADGFSGTAAWLRSQSRRLAELTRELSGPRTELAAESFRRISEATLTAGFRLADSLAKRTDRTLSDDATADRAAPHDA